MKNGIKFFLRGLLLFVLILVVFYFWASSSVLPKNKKEVLFRNNFPVTITKDSVYTIVTYNIGYLSGMINNVAVKRTKAHKKLFKNNLKRVLEGVKKINTDIIALQEVDYMASRSYEVDQEKEIANLGYGYVARGVNWDKKYLPFPYWPIQAQYGKIVSGQSVLSKYPLKEYKRIVLGCVKSNPVYKNKFYIDRLLQVVKVEIEDKDVVVMNVHLEAFDSVTRLKQFKYVLDVFNRYKEQYPTILLGDFNSEARKKEAVIHEIINMKDVGNAFFKREEPENTFNSVKPTKRIDYIFYTKQSIEYIDGRILNEFSDISDHLPLEMKFRLK